MGRTSRASPSVCLVDDDPALCQAIRLLLKTAGLKLTTFHSAAEFLAGYEPRQTGCILLDVRMPGMNGLELLDILSHQKVSIPIVVLTGYADMALAVRAVHLGAFDVIEKPFDEVQLLERIHQALAISKKWKAVEADRAKIKERLARLSPRELQVLDLMVGGRTNIDIAKHLGISRKTLDIHRAKVLEKMEARTVADLARCRLLEKYPASAASIIKEYDSL